MQEEAKKTFLPFPLALTEAQCSFRRLEMNIKIMESECCGCDVCDREIWNNVKRDGKQIAVAVHAKPNESEILWMDVSSFQDALIYLLHSECFMVIKLIYSGL